MLIRFAIVAVIAAATAGCASKSATHFTRKDVATVHVNPKFCKDIPGTGDLECNRVRVTLATIDAKAASK